MSARKQPNDRTNRNPKVHPDVLITNDGVVRGPHLPRNRSWNDETRKWWSTVRKNPVSQLFGEPEWEALLTVALLVDRFWEPMTPTNQLTALSKEIRSAIAPFGLLQPDRNRLGLWIEDVSAEAEKITKSAASDYRSKLGRSDSEEENDDASSS